MEKPLEVPEMSPVKLVTMTIQIKLPQHFNLKVMAESIAIDSEIIGVKHLYIKKGNYADDPKPGRFKNECTFNINVGDKIINTKLFINGKIVNTGCLSEEHAIISTNIVLKRLQYMEKVVEYELPDSFCGKQIKKFFKDDIRKTFGTLYQLLICYFGMDTDLSPFEPNLTADESFMIFMDIIEDNSNKEDNYNNKLNVPYIRDIMYIYTIISILKCYYPKEELVDYFDEPDFQYLLTVLEDSTDREKGIIKCELPSYLNNTELIVFSPDNVITDLINKGTNCNYCVNRNVLYNIITNMIDTESDKPYSVVYCTYEKSNYPGVIIEYRLISKIVKIIVFNTGKINITATKTHEQVKHAYDFIKNLCSEHFDKLLLTSVYDNKKFEFETSLPDQHYVGHIEGETCYLLRKKSILANPRNVRILYDRGLIGLYKD